MNKWLRLYLVCLLLLTATNGFSQRETLLLKSGWKFRKGNNSEAFQKDFNDTDWESVHIPHDWAIREPFIADGDGTTGKLPWKDEAWYRLSLHLPKNYHNKRIFLLCDGIMAFPSVYVNGKLAGKWDYGYNAFYLDITDLVNVPETNTLAIHADTRMHDSRWYPGAGIYRNIQLIAVNPLHINLWGIHVCSSLENKNKAKIYTQTSITNNYNTDKNIIIKHTLWNGNKKIIEKDSLIHSEANNSKTIATTLQLKHPILWDIDKPHLYKLTTEIFINGKLIDNEITNIGIRDLKFTPDDGLHLNGKRLQIKGVNLHHDLGALGAACNRYAMQRQLEIMKAMGCNAIRTSHNPPASQLLDLCDKMGLLVFEELFDQYNEKADITDTTDFKNFALRNIRNTIQRDRNHPCIFIWSVGNEMYDVQLDKDHGFEKLKTTVSYVKQYDSMRPVTMVCDNYESANLRHFDFYDVHCWNYGRRYSLARKIAPQKSVIISESSSTVSTRGFYELPLPKNKTDFTTSLQVSSYDYNAPGWAELPDDDFMWQQQDKYVAGEFVWTGFDYLGEPTPYTNTWAKNKSLSAQSAARSSYFGIVDLCGIPKDRYYLYKSYWKPEETTLHILPHWNWENDTIKTIPVRIYTNGDCAELFVNGKSQGKKCKNPLSNKSSERFRICWDSVTYSPGKLTAIAYKNGRKTAEKSVYTAGKPYKIKLSPHKKTINADGEDISYILIEAVDKTGNLCPLATNEIKINLKGVGEIAAVDNGNPQSLEPFNADKVNLFHGKAMLMVKSGNKKGRITIHAQNPVLQSATTFIKVQ